MEATTLLAGGEQDRHIDSDDRIPAALSLFISYMDEFGNNNIKLKVNLVNEWCLLIVSLPEKCKDNICLNSMMLTKLESWLESALQEVSVRHNTVTNLSQPFNLVESLLNLMICIVSKSFVRQRYITRNHPSLLTMLMQKVMLHRMSANGNDPIRLPANSLCEKLLLAIAQLTARDERTASPLCDMDGACEALLSYFEMYKVASYDGRIQHGAYSILNTMSSVVSSATVEKREELLPAIWETFKSIVWILDSDFAMNNYDGTVLIAVANFFECIVQNLPNDNSASLLQLVDFCHCASEKNVPLLTILNGMESGNILYKKIGLPFQMKCISRVQDIYIILNDKLAQLGSLHDSSGLNSADTERLAWAQSHITIGKSTELSFSLVH